MRTRRARAGDAEAIARLVEFYAASGVLLPRSRKEILAGIENFLVLADRERVAGCLALERYSADLAEIRSVAVNPELRGRGLGARLLRAGMAEAGRRGYARVFAVTRSPGFFLRRGFQAIGRHALTEKIERDCAVCPRAGDCRLAGVVAQVADRRVNFPLAATNNETRATA
jgi:amino-acid N-acetyltransferase